MQVATESRDKLNTLTSDQTPIDLVGRDIRYYVKVSEPPTEE